MYSPTNSYLDELTRGVSQSLELLEPIGYNTPAEVEQNLFNHPYLAGINFANITVRFFFFFFQIQ